MAYFQFSHMLLVYLECRRGLRAVVGFQYVDSRKN